jgi:hypothetical protein
LFQPVFQGWQDGLPIRRILGRLLGDYSIDNMYRYEL